MFPFGEMICFTTMLPFLNKRRSGRKTGLTALLFSGIILSVTHAIQISVLGEDIYGRAVFPLLTTIGKVNLADFLQRMDIIAILTFFIGDFFQGRNLLLCRSDSGLGFIQGAETAKAGAACRNHRPILLNDAGKQFPGAFARRET